MRATLSGSHFFTQLLSNRNKFAMTNNKEIGLLKVVLLILFIMVLMVACNSGEANIDVSSTETTQNITPSVDVNTDQSSSDTESGYPYPGIELAESANSGYPADTSTTEDAFSEPPDPERNIPAPSADSGSVGGVLIREISDAGFLPVMPQALYLGEILNDSEGREALIAQGEDSPQAQLFQTGVFIFDNIAPGTYGLVIDIGVSQFPITGEDGQPLLITVEANKVLDLGQVIIKVPNS